MILSGQTIQSTQIITPYYDRTKYKGMTFGCGPAGYDVRVEFDETGIQKSIIIGAGQFILASTIEHFRMPENVMGLVHDKSSWARKGLAVQNTIIEPGWYGFLTLELTNHGLNAIHIERLMPIAQVVFHFVDKNVERSYTGKYQNQRRGPVETISDN